MELVTYLDNSATTKPFEEVVAVMNETLIRDFGNPSSLHTKGMEAEQYVKEARKILAQTLKAKEKEIIFTSGGTESNNMALIGAALANRRAGNHIITTCIEHPSVHNPLLFLEEMGFEVTYLPVNQNGHINLDTLRDAIQDTTILVSIMYVNNEIGAVQPIDIIAKTIKEKNPSVLFHVDAIQAYGKYRIFPERMGIDLLSVSAHKVHGPKGVGFLYVKDKVKIKPLIWGGEQQGGMRSGTENVPGIAGFGKAASIVYDKMEDKVLQMYQLKRYLIARVQELPNVWINGVGTNTIEDTAPHIISISFSDVRSEVLLHALSDRGILVSSGSACASNHPSISGTLKAIGVKKELLDNTIRVSLSEMTTREEIDSLRKALEEILPMLRRFVRK
ncbi:MAG: cysteine desulfurase [Clostridiales bacterium]|nr:cysteine desulfurase [Clostridiales bacterium]